MCPQSTELPMCCPANLPEPQKLCISRESPLVSCKEVCDLIVWMEGIRCISEALWQDSREEILKALHHPFVRQLGAGSLPRFVSRPSVLEISQELVKALYASTQFGIERCNLIQYQALSPASIAIEPRNSLSLNRKNRQRLPGVPFKKL